MAGCIDPQATGEVVLLIEGRTTICTLVTKELQA